MLISELICGSNQLQLRFRSIEPQFTFNRGLIDP